MYSSVTRLQPGFRLRIEEDGWCERPLNGISLAIRPWTVLEDATMDDYVDTIFGRQLDIAVLVVVVDGPSLGAVRDRA